jgi:NADH-quinone oxidoreductase subunit G
MPRPSSESPASSDSRRRITTFSPPPAGSVEMPLVITEMPDGVVWLPVNSTGGGLYRDLGALPGQLVSLAAGNAAGSPAAEQNGADA